MTNNNPNQNSDRLDRIEAIVEFNSRAIQAMMEQQATDRLKREEETARHQEQMNQMRETMRQLANVEQGLANMMVEIDENQPTILRKLGSIENKVDSLIERGQYPPL